MTTPIRDESIYISYASRVGLRYVAEAMELEGRSDALADQIIIDWLRTNHPTVVDHMNDRQQAEKDFKQVLSEKLNTKPFVRAS